MIHYLFPSVPPLVFLPLFYILGGLTVVWVVRSAAATDAHRSWLIAVLGIALLWLAWTFVFGLPYAWDAASMFKKVLAQILAFGAVLLVVLVSLNWGGSGKRHGRTKLPLVLGLLVMFAFPILGGALECILTGDCI